MKPSVTVVIMTEPTVKEKGVWGREETVSSVSSKKNPKTKRNKNCWKFSDNQKSGKPQQPWIAHGGCIGD